MEAGRVVLGTIRRRALLADGDRVAVAVSGGPDSVALIWLLRDLEARAGWSLAGLIHVHHGLRGVEADADEAFCRALADRLGLPIHVARGDVRQLARERRVSLEAAGRLARYAAFQAAAPALAANVIATGHTLDDQAETVLLRLLRGAGTRGLSAIRPRRGPYVRPLIDCRRRALVGYLHARGEAFREDQSNHDLSIPRNRLRSAMLPIVDADWPGGVVALARFAELAADDESFLMAAAHGAAVPQSRTAGGGVQLDRAALNDLPAALARRVVRSAIESAGGVPSFRHVEAVRRLAHADKPDGRIDLPELAVSRLGSALRFERSSGPTRAGAAGARAAEPARRLEVPGSVALSETGATIWASLREGADQAAAPALSSQIALLQADALRRPLAVRYRRPGDRLRPLGAPGSRKLQDWFVDRKVPRGIRDRVPLVVDAEDRIVWVAGFTIAHECRVTTPEAGVVVLELDKGNK